MGKRCAGLAENGLAATSVCITADSDNLSQFVATQSSLNRKKARDEVQRKGRGIKKARRPE